jgi:hypothetical protein
MGLLKESRFRFHRQRSTLRGHKRISRHNNDAEALEPRRLLSTYIVNTLSDAVNPVAGKLTLRQAVADADADAGADTIVFDRKVFTSGSRHTVTLTQGQILLTDTTGPTTIIGPGAKAAAVSGNSKSRIFDIAADATVSISGLTLTQGKSTTADSSGNTYGGAIASAGTLTITDSVLSGNTVEANGSTSPDAYGNIFPGIGRGGAIYSTGTLTLTSSTLSGDLVRNDANDASDGPSSIEGEHRQGGYSEGGAIYASGELTLTSATITRNSAVGFSGTGDGGAGYGGGVYTAGVTTITSSVISGNIALGGHGDKLYADGGNASGGGVWAASMLSIANSTITRNSCDGGNTNRPHGNNYGGYSGEAKGGGVYDQGNLTIAGSEIRENRAIGGRGEEEDPTLKGLNIASGGGGVCCENSAALTNDTIIQNRISGAYVCAGGGVLVEGAFVGQASMISDCTVNDNVVTPLAGSALGGGVEAVDGGTIKGSTISGNTCRARAGGDGRGGGISDGTDGAGYSTYEPFTYNELQISDSTISNNRAIGGHSEPGINAGSAYGGGIDGSPIITNCTVTGNSAIGGAGGLAGDGDTNYAGNAKGGGVFGEGTITNCTIVANSIASGKGASNAPIGKGVAVFCGTR